ncbi:hypothetical protein R3P38DRAFT_2948941 [Favolaschia claudopus]|uniref:DUF6535 domain-containing protein n=1 Tax=Favolaschia claudopus TaxID=2862362 RepID=A0AAW0BJN4_9AGAR
MGGLVIFAGLFSAILTAFLIESYKTLTLDSGDETVLLLNQISMQLSGIANGSSVHITPPDPFIPSTSSLVCNLLWFISLGLSLSCAFIATLVGQWARDFIYKTEMRTSPVIRARIFAYLYYGLKRFNMHAVVEVIPFLLHLSLIIFFAGLVAFLVPVNRGVMFLSIALLGILVIVYAFLTVLPVFSLDSPYQTPLSGGVWRFAQFVSSISWRITQFVYGIRRSAEVSNDFMVDYRRSEQVPNDSMVNAMNHVAVCSSRQRDERDHRALCWTVRSLADDSEVEPFLEGISDVLGESHSDHRPYDGHIAILLRNPDVRLLGHLERFLRGSFSDTLPPEIQNRRRMIALKVLWGLSTIPVVDSRYFTRLDSFDLSLLHRSRDLAEQYRVSACAVLYLNAASSLFDEVNGVIGVLNKLAGGVFVDDENLHQRLAKVIYGIQSFDRHGYLHMNQVLSAASIKAIQDLEIMMDVMNCMVHRSEQWMEKRRSVTELLYLLLAVVERHIFAAFMVDAARLGTPPYRFQESRDFFPFRKSSALVKMDAAFPSINSNSIVARMDALEPFSRAFRTIVDDQTRYGSYNETADEILVILLTEYHNAAGNDGPQFCPDGLAHYILTRNHSESAILRKFDHLWLLSGLTARLTTSETWRMDIPEGSRYFGWESPREIRQAMPETIEAIWQMANIMTGRQWQREIRAQVQQVMGGALDSLRRRAPSGSATASTIALIQNNLLNPVLTHGEELLTVNLIRAYPLLPLRRPCQDSEDSNGEPGIYLVDAHFTILADFLRQCSRHHLPYNTKETIELLTRFDVGLMVAVDLLQQSNFAKTWKAMLEELHGLQIQTTLAEVFLNSQLLSAYFDTTDNMSRNRWLDDPSAKSVFVEGLVLVEECQEVSSELRTRLESIKTILTL